MKREEIIGQLRSQSTWRLAVLILITWGIYLAHYIRRQTNRLNQCLDEQHRISRALVISILILSYITVILAVHEILVEEGQGQPISLLLNLTLAILVLIWAFKARNRMNMLLGVAPDEPGSFDETWTLLFAVLYFNFKINKLYESGGGARSGPPAQR